MPSNIMPGIRHVVNIDDYKVGKMVLFGRFAGEEIGWKVLASTGGKRTMIAMNGLDAIPFNGSYSGGNWWKRSLIRTWLNDTFYNSAFSNEEKAMIAVGPTNDNVWLLNIREANKYFKNNAARVCYATQIAMNHGATTVEDTGACLWWLRSRGSDSHGAAFVDWTGSVCTEGNDIDFGDLCVRPAVVIQLT